MDGYPTYRCIECTVNEPTRPGPDLRRMSAAHERAQAMAARKVLLAPATSYRLHVQALRNVSSVTD